METLAFALFFSMILNGENHRAKIYRDNLILSKSEGDNDKLSDTIKQLKEGDEKDRVKAANSLKKMGKAASPAIPALIGSLKPRFPQSRVFPGDATPAAACEALVGIGQPAIPDLTNAIGSKDPLVRVLSASALWQIEKKSKPVVPVLLAAIRDRRLGDGLVYSHAVETLAAIGKEDASAVLPGLVKAFQSDDVDLIEDASNALGKMGSAAKGAIPELLRGLAKTDERPLTESGYQWGPHTLFAGLALRKIGADVVPSLVRIMQSKNLDHKRAAVWVLLGMGAKAEEAIPALVGIIENEKDKDILYRAIHALEQIAPGTKSAAKTIPALRVAAKNDDEMVRSAATAALNRIEEAAKGKK